MCISMFFAIINCVLSVQVLQWLRTLNCSLFLALSGFCAMHYFDLRTCVLHMCTAVFFLFVYPFERDPYMCKTYIVVGMDVRAEESIFTVQEFNIQKNYSIYRCIRSHMCMVVIVIFLSILTKNSDWPYQTTHKRIRICLIRSYFYPCKRVNKFRK